MPDWVADLTRHGLWIHVTSKEPCDEYDEEYLVAREQYTAEDGSKALPYSLRVQRTADWWIIVRNEHGCNEWRCVFHSYEEMLSKLLYLYSLDNWKPIRELM